MKPIVYFSKNLTPNELIKLYKKLNMRLEGRVAVKLHSGEPGNQNFLGPDFFGPIIKEVNGTIVESNTAYDGLRNTTKKHLETIQKHGWMNKFQFDLLDAEGPDLVLDIPNGKVIKKNYVGKDLVYYDSMLVLSHFKGHPMGGYGGALKQLSIGIASSYGKAYIHGCGKPEDIWTSNHDQFLESMADAAESIVRYFNGQIVYINVMKNMSVDCDCCAVAEGSSFFSSITIDSTVCRNFICSTGKFLAMVSIIIAISSSVKVAPPVIVCDTSLKKIP